MSVLAKLRQAFNIIVGARNALIEKGETVEYDDDIPQIIEDMDTGGGADTEVLKKLIERPSDCEIVIPDTVTSIGEGAFAYFKELKTITIPDSVETIRNSPFIKCDNLVYAYVNSKQTGNLMFAYPCPKLTTIILGPNVERINDRLAAGISSLTTVYISNSIKYILDMFYNCPNLEFVTIENGFNANNLKLNISTAFSTQTIVSWLNALADRTGRTAYTLNIGSTNLAKLTSDQIAIATNKNWNLA